MFCVLKISVLIAFGILLSYCKKHERRDGKLVLNPIELIDLITEEKLRTELSSEDYKANRHAQETINLLDMEEEMTTERECRDEETLRTRKVWSRWGKWGSCSVTCGAGAVTRTRACVAGRCARGEREEQRRPCVRAPCEGAHTLPDAD